MNRRDWATIATAPARVGRRIAVTSLLGLALVSRGSDAPAPVPSAAGLATPGTNPPAPLPPASLTTSSWEADLRGPPPAEPDPPSSAPPDPVGPALDASALTNLDLPALISSLPSTNLVSEHAPSAASEQGAHLRRLQAKLELARRQRRERESGPAIRGLVSLMETNAPVELKRAALFELALVHQEANELARAQQIFAQYLRLHPQDPSVPEVLLRQGLLYRQMGANAAAIRKFYAVITTSLNLKLGELEYYQRLVLQAQTEIADTHFLEGNFEEAGRFFRLLLKLDSPKLNRPAIQFKLIRSLAQLDQPAETAGQAQLFLDQHPTAPEVLEVRFLLALALKQQGRNSESLAQVIRLLESQKATAAQNPEIWAYWQKRAGNEIANQLYKEGDYLNTLQLYQHLAELDSSPAWQLPVWYQIGLVLERLRQTPKATETYTRIIDRQKALTGEQATPSLLAVIDMARWRKENLAWIEQAHTRHLAIQRQADLDSTPPAAP